MEKLGESIFISEIKSENDLKKRIKNLIDEYKKSIINKEIIFLRFIQSNSKKLRFIIPFLKRNNENENIKFICIIHIKRSLENKDNVLYEKIYTIPNIYNNVDQLFIDHLKKFDENGENKDKKGQIITLENQVNDYLDNTNLTNEFENSIALQNNELIKKINQLEKDNKILKNKINNLENENIKLITI